MDFIACCAKANWIIHKGYVTFVLAIRLEVEYKNNFVRL